MVFVGKDIMITIEGNYLGMIFDTKRFYFANKFYRRYSDYMIFKAYSSLPS